MQRLKHSQRKAKAKAKTKQRPSVGKAKAKAKPRQSKWQAKAKHGVELQRHTLRLVMCGMLLRDRKVGVRFWFRKANSDPTHTKGDQTYTHSHSMTNSHAVSTQKALYCTHPMCFVMVFAGNMGPVGKPCGWCEFCLATQAGPV